MKVWQIRFVLTATYVWILFCSLLSFILVSILWSFWVRLCDDQSRDDCLVDRKQHGIKYTDMRHYICGIALFGLFPSILSAFYCIVAHMMYFICNGSRKAQSTSSWVFAEAMIALALMVYSFLYVLALTLTFFCFRCDKEKHPQELNRGLGKRVEEGRIGCSTVYYHKDASSFNKLGKVNVNAFLISALSIQAFCGLLWGLALGVNVYVLKSKFDDE